MACGTPAVVTTEGGLWEQIVWGLDALYSNPFDPEAFGHAITVILQHPQIAAQLAKFGSQKARARFTWSGIAQQLLSHVGRHELTRIDGLSLGEQLDEDDVDELPRLEEAAWSG
jgi:mannosylfructose-phosphate synthase